MASVKLFICLTIIVPVFSGAYHSMSNSFYGYGQPSYSGGLYGMADYGDMYDASQDMYMDAFQNQYQMNMLSQAGLGNGYGMLGYDNYQMVPQYAQQYQGMNTIGIGQAPNAVATVQNAPMSQATATIGGNNDHASTVADIIRSILAGQSVHQSNAVRKYVVV